MKRRSPAPYAYKATGMIFVLYLVALVWLMMKQLKKIIDEFGDLCGKLIDTQSSFLEALQEFITVGYNKEKTLGNIFIKLKQQRVK